MTQPSPIFVKGHYHVVALREQGEDQSSDIIGYAVLTSAGVKVRHEIALDDAKAWVEQQVENEGAAPLIEPQRVKPRKRGR